MASHKKKRTCKMTDKWLNIHSCFYVAFFLRFSAVIFFEVFPLSAQESCDHQRRVLTSPYGTISSGGKQYPEDSHCEWLIKANNSKQFISLSFVKMDTECGYDYIFVYDGSSYASSLLGSFSGNTTPTTVIARSGDMLILLYSDNNYVRTGFEATFSITDCPLNCSGKGYCLNHHCVCNSHQTGEACDVDLCPVNCGQSEGRGECIELLNQKCKCKPGYSGFDCSLPDSNENGGNTWHTVSPDKFPDKQRASHSGVYIESLDTFYLYGGYSFGKVHGDVIAYDFRISEWINITTSDGPRPRRNHASASFFNNFVIFGGELADGNLSDEFWLFNTSSHQWRQIVPSSTVWPPPLAKHTLTIVQDYWIYLYGGILSNNSFSSDMYRTRIDGHISWERIVTFCGEKYNRRIVGHSAVYYHPMNSIFIYGGVIVKFSNVSKLNHNIYVFHIGKKCWTLLNFHKNENMPLERAFHTAAIIGEYMVVHGGYAHRHSHEEVCYDNRTYLYDLECHKWIDMANLTKGFSGAENYMTKGIFSHVMAVRHGHTLLIHGGYSGVMHSSLYAYVLPSFITGHKSSNNACHSHKNSESCRLDLMCIWCNDQNMCIERKRRKICSSYVSDSCPGLCKTLFNCHSCLIWGDPAGMNAISDVGPQDNFPVASCSWHVKDMHCLPVNDANFHSLKSESNMVATSVGSPVTWWGPNQTVLTSVKDCTSEDFPAGLLSIKYRHPVNWSQPDGVLLLKQATEELYLFSELRQNDSTDGTLMNVVKFLAFLHPFSAKPLSERLAGLNMCSGGSSLATLKLSNDTLASHMEIVASHASKSSHICSPVERPSGAPLFPYNTKDYKYLLEFSVNVSTMINETSNMQLVWNYFSVQPEVISYHYLEPYGNGSCSKHKNCLACLTDGDCGWCEARSSCHMKRNATELVCQLNGESHFLITQPSECPTCSDLVYCSHCTQVSFCEWLIDAAFCVRRGRFKNSVRESHFCPKSCHLRTNCTSCLIDPGICAWCESTQTCFLFSTYTTSYMFGLCRDWVFDQRHVANVSPVGVCHDCSRYKDCKQCLQQLNCGWCSYVDNPSFGVCIHGDFKEPSEQSCLARLQEEHNSSKAVGLPQWSYDTCPDVEECLLGLHDCHPNATCKNTPDSYECQCSIGFKGDGKACTRACAVQCMNGYCSEAPHYKCICQLGWTGEDCGIDCGCHNHSTCSSGPGKCDKCEKFTEGEFCERCSPGSYGSAVSNIGCQKCNCNGHGDSLLGYCNSTSGVCYCKDNTEGPNCTRCQNGYFGDPKNGGHCYEECQPRGVKTTVVSGKLGSSRKSSSTADCLWLLTIHPVLDVESLLLPKMSPSAAIELTIEENIKIPCPHNHIYVYDGLPDFIAAEHPSVLLGAFCGINLSKPISVIATSGYLTVHFKHSGVEEGFNANYTILEDFFEDNQTCISNSCENYSVNVNYDMEFCPNNCSGAENHGVCDQAYGKCICENGHGGDNCSVKLKPYSLVWSSIYNYAQLLERDINAPSGRIGHSLVSLNNEMDEIEDVWLFGGYSHRYGELSDMFVFETLTRQWIKLELDDEIPPPRYFHATATFKEFIYIFGGMTNKSLLGDFWEFNSRIESWYKMLTPDFIKPMAGSTLTAVENGSLYLIGGLSVPFGFFDKVAMFDISTNLWHLINCTGAQPIGIYGHTSVYHRDTDSIYMFGGVSYEENNLEISNKLYAFKLSTKQWFRLPPDVHVNPIKTRPQPRYFHTAIVTKNYMLIFGGRSSSSDKSFPGPYGYVFSCNAWISLSDEDIDFVGKPPDSIIGGASTVANGDIYLFSSYDGELKSVYLPVDLCELFSSSRVRCILHVGCAFCSVFENGVNQTFCYSQALNTPSSCYNPKVASEVVPAATCDSGWIEKRDCGQYISCTDCVAQWPAFNDAKQVCQWCSNCKVGRCIPVGTSCENENDCNIPLKVINDSSVCPSRMCWASDCGKCLQIGHCIWTRQVQRLGGFGYNLSRKPIYNWICVMKEIQDAPSFPTELPPMNCPTPCMMYRNCSTCLQSAGGEGGSHQCIWSEATKTCMTPSFELLRCEDGSCGPVIQGNASQCPLPCWHYEQAAHCLAHANCGWCAFTNTPVDGWGLCIEGGIMGPTGGLCKENQVLLLGAPLPVQVERKFASSRGPPKWTYLTMLPENECINGHHTCDERHQVCVDTPTSFECHCKPGYELRNDQTNECKPICRQGCVNGTCIEPDVCKCNFGYVGKNCSLACKCNGHSDCPGPEQLTVCPSCQNNTQGLYCQSCKPFFVGNPQNGGSCIPCLVYCHGHSNICLNSELLTLNSSVVTQPYNKTHIKLSLINNAEKMRQLFENQQMQTILSNPENVRQVISNSPEARQSIDMSELLDKITEGSWSDAVCIDCQNNTQGKRCDQCVPGFFKAGDAVEDGCRPCECHGHGDTCNPYTGEGCNCQNNTENDRQCSQKNTKNIITPCWQLQCSKCKEYFLGAPAHGHQCYRHMFLDKDYCFDPNTHDECNRKPSSLLQGRTVFFAVQPRYMNVDIRIVVDVTDGGVDFLLSAKEDTFVVEVNKTTGIHYISIDKKYGVDLRNDFEYIYHGSSEANRMSKRATTMDDSIQDVSNYTESPSSSSLFIRDVDLNDLTTYITVKKSQEFMLVRNLQNRLIITIPQQVHDLRSTRFYMVLRGVGNEKVSVTYGNLFFRQDQTRIDLFVFFSVFFSCFFLFLAICVVVWKVKQAFDIRRARRLHAAEMKHMASRPFGHVITIVEDEPDDYDFQFYSPTNCRKKMKHNKVYGRDSPKTGEERYCLRPIAVEPLSNGTAAVATILVQLPGGAHSLVKMTLASALITSRSSHYHVGYGIRAVMRRRTSHANV